MNYGYYRQFINETTKGRSDATPIFHNTEAFSNLIKDLAKPFGNIKIDRVIGLEALGFIIGGAFALSKNVGFVPIRKGGKLPYSDNDLEKISFVDYSKVEKTFEINKSAIKSRDRVLLVDEWIETGTQIKSAIKLIEKLGGEVVGITVLSAHRRESTEILFEKYNLHAINIIEE